MTYRRPRGFTLVELLVVIGIIALLIGILLPTLGRAREASKTIKCLANLRTLGQATTMFSAANKGSLPYPTTGLGEDSLWFNALDPYLAKAKNFDATQSGVASTRTYTRFKQCEVYDTFNGDELDTGTGGKLYQNKTKQYARTYKMNSHLRNNGRASGDNSMAKVNWVKETARTVYLGDGVSLDLTGEIENQFESGQFSFEVNDKTQASPAIRHQGGANLLFIDGHAENVRLKTITKSLRSPNANVKVKTWESEYVNAAGVPSDISNVRKTLDSQNLTRNPNMPYIWSELNRPDQTRLCRP